MILLLAGTIAFISASLAIFLAYKQSQTINIVRERETKQKQRLYEIAVLKEIQDRIGYSLDIEKVIDVITGSLRNLFSYSAASSLVIKEDKLVFKAYIEESVNHAFIDQIKKTLIASLEILADEPLSKNIEENIAGIMIDESNTLTLGSFFNIPLNVNNKIVGIINISSTRKNLYKENEMTILYQITNQASNALSKLQQVLTTEKGKLIGMIRSLTDGVFMVDINNQLLVINDAARSMLALTEENPTSIDVYRALGKRYDIIEKIQTATAEKKPVVGEEILLGKKTVQVFINPVLDTQTQTMIGASILLHDITLEKSVEEMREDFTNMMVHELRAPLTAIKGASQLMITHTDRLDKDETQKLLAIINKQTKRMIDEVSLLLDTSKLEAGKFMLQKAIGDIKKVIEETITIFTPQAQQKNITLTATIPPSLPSLWLDQQRIAQVFNNLLSNSIKFTPDGGKINVMVKQEGDAVFFSISDTGIGIPKEEQNELFSRFFQITYPGFAGVPNKLQLGTGLGLYFVKGVVEAHGGKVMLQSEVGKGTTVSFNIPLDHKATEAMLQPPPLTLHPSLQPN
ncbi:MAG: GAF domain-containing protein [Candidatus Levybacteria bacterium]|nr:GAF domain-containing protein [Candidatus Levybacteria bacterium]